MNSRHQLSGSLALFCFILTGLGCLRAVADVVVEESERTVIIENGLVAVLYDLDRGTYSAIDRRNNSAILSGAYSQIHDFVSNAAALRHTWENRPVTNELGTGKALIVTSSKAGMPHLLSEFTLYKGQGHIVMAVGIENTTRRAIQLKRLAPLARGIAFEGFNLAENFSMLDGHGGGQSTGVTHGSHLRSRNNLLVTFGSPGRVRSLVLGGLTYHEFEKFAEVGPPPRRSELERRDDVSKPLLCYLNLGVDRRDGRTEGPTLQLIQGGHFTYPNVDHIAVPECATVAFDGREVVLEATNLDRRRSYQLGFSWWDEASGRVESVSVQAGARTPRLALLRSQPLPAGAKGQYPQERNLVIPRQAYRSGRVRIIFTRESGVNAVVSEAWLREGDGRADAPPRSIPASGDQPPEALAVRLFAEDPVGKRVDPGSRYLPDDRFYIDFATDDPFDALETYGLSVRGAQHIDLNTYDFPTVCLWYGQHHLYGDGPAHNDTPGAVAEMDRIIRSGFLTYSRAAVRLVPDNYGESNQQGWWDDKHWQMYGSGINPKNIKVEPGHYKKPYETTAKWGKAVRDRGGIPLIYCQTGRVSRDYSKAFPDHMLFNRTSKSSYDYTDPGFIQHMREVYANLRAGSIMGLMFDYAHTGWPGDGGLEDRYASAALAYRNIFRLAYDGLGADCYLHERNLHRGSDITLGLVASQRIWSDTDQINPEMVTRGGLRWYKNRVVVNYDMDAKNLLKARPRNRDGVRRMLTMSYVAGGRLVLGTSFARFNRYHLHDLQRVFPFHSAPRSARPIDAFTNLLPQVYDFKVNPQWHQITFYNYHTDKPARIGVELAGHTASGALGLDAGESYYVYDFWNDRFIGKLSGGQRLEQQLRPGEARMMSIHQVVGRPQFLSTNRHLMQGYVELSDVRWEGSRRRLTGRCRVVGGETYRVVIAVNGYRPTGSTAQNAESQVEMLRSEHGLMELRIDKPESAVVDWTVTFERAR